MLSHAGHPAFTLVETALALLAIGIGLIGLFGLGRIALESSHEAENDRRCAAMADAVFETLRAVNEIYVNEARTNEPYGQLGLWNTLWQEGGDDQVGLATLPRDPRPVTLWGDIDGRGTSLLFPPVADMSTNNVALVYEERIPVTSGTWPWILDYNWPAYDENQISLDHWNPRYHLSIRSAGEFFRSPDFGNFNVLQVTLHIFPDGNVGSSNPRVFTTTLSNPGGMQ